VMMLRLNTNIRMRMKLMSHEEQLLAIRKELIEEALQKYDTATGLYGYTILRAARDGLLQVKE